MREPVARWPGCNTMVIALLHAVGFVRMADFLFSSLVDPNRKEFAEMSEVYWQVYAGAGCSLAMT